MKIVLIIFYNLNIILYSIIKIIICFFSYRNIIQIEIFLIYHVYLNRNYFHIYYMICNCLYIFSSFFFINIIKKMLYIFIKKYYLIKTKNIHLQ